jgi:two-component sensor histidine kinase
LAAPLAPQAGEPDVSLALAMVLSSPAPLLLLDGELMVIAASASFCRVFGLQPAAVAGHPFFELGDGEWDVRQLRALIDATASGDAAVEAYEMDLKAPERTPRRVVIHVQKLAYGDPDRTRLLVAVTDLTETRLSEQKNHDLRRENEILIQEVRHRVANSLQIIASVLMQSARIAASKEARVRLRDAHNRVMSVADLQKQLAVTTQVTVAFRAYLTKLCATIAASMIGDPKALVLEVVADDAIIDAGVSVNLGLIVTELVINALKHGFPDNMSGKITVGYLVLGPGWTLSVDDNGVGMPKDPAKAKPGLGSSIIQALAKQLGARIEMADMAPGTKVSIIYPAVSAELGTLRPVLEPAV